MRPTIAVVLAVASAAVTAGPAAAQDPTTTTPPVTPAPPVTAKLDLRLEKVGGKQAQVLAGTPWRARGTLVPYVAGQRVAVRFYRHGKKIAVKNVLVQASSTGNTGFFLVSFRAKQAGRITVRASHRATPQLNTAVAPGRSVDVLALDVHAGQRGPVVRLLQRQLAKLGYVVGVRGLFDDRTQRAVMAFRKVTGMPRTFDANAEVFRRLARGEGRFKVKYPSHGRHVEADISKQVLAMIGAGGKVERIYHISSGAPWTPTVLGSFRVYSQQLGVNQKGMVDSSYFIRGYAIHGYYSVPPYNASHGCLRVPVPDARSIHDWLRLGTIVDTYV